MSEEPFDPARTALLVVDMQNDFVEEGAPLELPEARRILPTLRKVIDAARSHPMPVIYSAHVHRPGGADMGIHRDLFPPVGAGKALVDGGRGVEIYPEISPQEGDLVIKKHRYNSFYGTDLEIVLRGLGVETVVLAGMTTECCVLGTARGALECGFRSLVLADACASCDYPDVGSGAMSANDMHLAALRIMSMTSSKIIDVETLCARLS